MQLHDSVVGLVAVVLSLTGAGIAIAEEPVNASLLGVAVKGTDVVAYFTDSKPMEGSKAFEHTWHGAKWRFANAEHLALFVGEPAKYAPQYGGYCAWAMSENRKAPIDPNAWRLVDGRLYLNYSKDIQTKWEVDIPGFIANADAFWMELAK